MTEKYKKLARNLVWYSCSVKEGEKVLVEQSGVPEDFLVILVEEIIASGGIPFVRNGLPKVSKAMMKAMTAETAKLKAKFDLELMKEMDAYISISGTDNVFENSDIPASIMQDYSMHYVKPVHIDERVNNTKWVILRWPSAGFAQSAGMSSEAFEKMYFDVCTMDYGKMSGAMDSLVSLMEKTDKVRIVGEGTDITFSIKGVPAIKCAGKNNIPDGEVFTAPIKNSVNGRITFNVPTLYNGIRFDNVCLVVESGKIVSATAGGGTKKLNEILDTDDGARFFGEFAIGVNPFVKKPMLDILFDEKICGSIHLTPGGCYTEAPNGNDSSIHWDMVLCQLKECGGGEIYFDDKLIRQNGIFVVEELLPLNPENLC